MSTPAFSVVICVYTEERLADIRDAVASVGAQSLPALETLVVVDHNESLRARLVAEFKEVQGVRVLANSGARGLSAGRNTGIAAALGDVLAFLDDDAVADEDWLRHFAAALEDPAVLAVGGRTLPRWDSGRRPPWFPEEFDWALGCSYRGLPRGQVRVRNVHGGNAAFRRRVFTAAGGFATGIGRDGATLPLGGEETELCIRLARAVPGARVVLDDRAVIHHRVPLARERPDYLRRRAYAEGLSKALIARRVGARDGLATERSYTTRVLPAGLARGLGDFVRARPGGLGRSIAIVTGVGAAATGYAVGRARALRDRPGFRVEHPLAGDLGDVQPGKEAP